MEKTEKFLDLAKFHAELFSKDPSTKVAAIVIDENHNIVSIGYNGLPRKFKETEERWRKPTKYNYVVHAEANAIATAARNGVKLDGTSMVTTLFPCNECAKLIVQAGITKIFTMKPKDTSSWLQSFEHSKEMFEECGVSVEYVRHFSSKNEPLLDIRF